MAIDRMPATATMTLEEAADVLKVDVKWVYEVIKTHDLPHFRLGRKNGRIRLWKKPFYLWLSARTTYGLQGYRGEEHTDGEVQNP